MKQRLTAYLNYYEKHNYNNNVETIFLNVFPGITVKLRVHIIT